MAASLKHWEETNTLYLFTSLTGGSSLIISRTNRLETILLNARIPFTHIDTATDESAKRLFQRRAKGKKLPLLVKEGFVLGTFEEIEEWNEYGELKEMIGEVAEGGERSVSAAPAINTMKPVSFDRELGIKPSIDSILSGGSSPGALSPVASNGNDKKLENTRPGGSLQQQSSQNNITKSLAEEAAAKAKTLKSSSGKKKALPTLTPNAASDGASAEAKEPLSPSAVPLPMSPKDGKTSGDVDASEMSPDQKSATVAAEKPSQQSASVEKLSNTSQAATGPTDDDPFVEPTAKIGHASRAAPRSEDKKATDNTVTAKGATQPTETTDIDSAGLDEEGTAQIPETAVDPDLSLPTSLPKPTEIEEVAGQEAARPSFVADSPDHTEDKAPTEDARPVSSAAKVDSPNLEAEKIEEASAIEDGKTLGDSNQSAIEEMATKMAETTASTQDKVSEVAKDVAETAKDAVDTTRINMASGQSGVVTDTKKSITADQTPKEEVQELSSSPGKHTEPAGLGLNLGESTSRITEVISDKISDAATAASKTADEVQTSAKEKAVDISASANEIATQAKEKAEESVANAASNTEDTAVQIKEKAEENLASVKASIPPITTQSKPAESEEPAVMRDIIERPSTPPPKESMAQEPKTPKQETPSKLNPVTPQVAPSKQFKMDKKETKPDGSPKPIHDQFMHFFF